MKGVLVGVMLLLSLSAFATKKKKPEAAFKKGNVTAIVGTGWPNVYRYHRGKSLGPFVAAVEHQVSRRWAFGLQYCYLHVNTGIQSRTVLANVGGVYTPTYSFQYEQKMTFHPIMVTVENCYLNRGRVCLGWGLGLGYVPQPTIVTRFLDNVDHSAQIGKVHYFSLALRLRLLDVKVRLTDNFGLCGGVGYGSDGFLSIGAHYTFKRKAQ